MQMKIHRVYPKSSRFNLSSRKGDCTEIVSNPQRKNSGAIRPDGKIAILSLLSVQFLEHFQDSQPTCTFMSVAYILIGPHKKEEVWTNKKLLNFKPTNCWFYTCA